MVVVVVVAAPLPRPEHTATAAAQLCNDIDASIMWSRQATKQKGAHHRCRTHQSRHTRQNKQPLHPLQSLWHPSHTPTPTAGEGAERANKRTAKQTKEKIKRKKERKKRKEKRAKMTPASWVPSGSLYVRHLRLNVGSCSSLGSRNRRG